MYISLALTLNNIGVHGSLPTNTQAVVGSCNTPYVAGCVDKVCNQFCQSKYGNGNGNDSHWFYFNTKCQRDTCVIIPVTINFQFHS